jgi:pimeloyl-ACP methyl ester carboxylesterase
MDLPGHGSHTASLEGLRINDCVDAVLAAIPLEGRIVLAGHSLGGAIALAVASQIPGRLAHLVLLAAMVPNSGAPVVSSLPPVMRFLNEALSKRAAALVQRAYGGARGQ